MRKLDSLLLRVFLYGLPIVIAFAVFVYPYDLETSDRAGGYIKALYNFGGFVFGAWMILSIYLSVRLIVSGLFREKVLAKITFIKERDEREEILTGKAAKSTMLTSLAILLFLLCLSCFQVSVYSERPEKAIDGKTTIVSLNVNFNALQSNQQGELEELLQKENMVSYSGLPVSSSAVILGLIIWQIISYNFSMRRLLK